MKREELVQQVAAVLRDSYRSVKDQELRHLMIAEKLVKTIIEPTVQEREKQILYLCNNRKSVFDS